MNASCWRAWANAEEFRVSQSRQSCSRLSLCPYVVRPCLVWVSATGHAFPFSGFARTPMWQLDCAAHMVLLSMLPVGTDAGLGFV